MLHDAVDFVTSAIGTFAVAGCVIGGIMGCAIGCFVISLLSSVSR